MLSSYSTPKNFLRSHVVSTFTSRSCEFSYVRETVRHLHTRVCDYTQISPLTGKKQSNPLLAITLLHHHDTDNLVSLDDFKIVSSCSFESELLLRESPLIRNLKPSLKSNIGSALLFLL